MTGVYSRFFIALGNNNVYARHIFQFFNVDEPALLFKFVVKIKNEYNGQPEPERFFQKLKPAP